MERCVTLVLQAPQGRARHVELYRSTAAGASLHSMQSGVIP